MARDWIERGGEGAGEEDVAEAVVVGAGVGGDGRGLVIDGAAPDGEPFGDALSQVAPLVLQNEAVFGVAEGANLHEQGRNHGLATEGETAES